MLLQEYINSCFWRHFPRIFNSQFPPYYILLFMEVESRLPVSLEKFGGGGNPSCRGAAWTKRRRVAASRVHPGANSVSGGRPSSGWKYPNFRGPRQQRRSYSEAAFVEFSETFQTLPKSCLEKSPARTFLKLFSLCLSLPPQAPPLLLAKVRLILSNKRALLPSPRP